jgi:hypothetical protein
VLDAAKGERLWPYLAVSMLGGIGPDKARGPRRPEVAPKPAPPTEAGAEH